ncbi:MAG: hypothetical protein L3I99_01905 [Sulfurimonas sp.]|nr:hypothetical protein [Sulfurimonas sp.]
MSCSINDKKLIWDNMIEEKSITNKILSETDIEDDVMNNVFAPIVSDGMSGKALDVFAFHLYNTSGTVLVNYNGGKNKVRRKILGVSRLDNGYEIGLSDGTKYAFINGSQRSKKTSSGQFVNIEVMNNIDGRIDASREFVDESINKLESENLFRSSDSTIKQGVEHEEIVNEIWKNPKEALSLFDLIVKNDGVNSSHTKKLRKLLGSIVDNTTPVFEEFKIYINKKAKENKGIAQVINDKKIVLDLADSDSSVSSDMSGAEVYMHELIHMSVEFARQHKRGALSTQINELNKLYALAKKSITVEQLVVDGKTDAAQLQWEKMFDNKDGISEFIALGMTNERVQNLLSKMKMNTERTSERNDTVFQMISNMVVLIFETIRSMVSKSSGLDGEEKLLWIVNEMWQHNVRTSKDASVSGKIGEYVSNARVSVDSAIVNAVNKAGSALSSASDLVVESNKDNIVGQYLGTTKNILKLTNPWLGKRQKLARNETMTELSQIMDGENDWLGLGWLFAPEGSIMTLVNFFGQDDNESIKVEKFGLINKKIDSNRSNTIVAIGGEIKNDLGKDVSKEEQTAVSSVIVEADLQSLTDTYSIDEIKNMISSDSEIEKNIEIERNNIDSLIDDTEASNYFKSQTMGLGHKMATGLGGSSIQNNAHDIVSMKNLELKDKTRFFDKDLFIELRSIVDRLASLEALKRTDKNDRDIVSKIKGKLDVTLAVHKMYVHKSVKHALEYKTGVLPIKGETKDTREDNMHSLINNGDKKTIKEMKKKGYRLVGPTHVSKMFLYTSSIMGMNSFSKQALAKINEAKKLNTVMGSPVSSVSNEIRVKVIKRYALNNSYEQMKSIVMPTLDGYVKIGNKNISDYAVSIDKKTYAKAMKQDNKAPILLGKMVAEINEKEEATVLNNEVYVSIQNDMKNYTRGDAGYIEIGIDARTKGETEKRYSEELLKNLPNNIRSRIVRRKKGQRFIAIRRDLAGMYVGARSPSLLNLRIPYAGKTISSKLRETEIGSMIANSAALVGEIWSEIVSIQKVDIVIKTPKVIIDNLISNINYTITLSGQMPWTVAANQLKMFRDTKLYLEKKREVDSLNIKITTALLNNKEKFDFKIKIRELNREMESMLVHDLMKAGLFTTVVEDIHDTDLTASSKIEKFIGESDLVKGIVDKTPQILKDGASVLYMTESTSIFKMMMMGVQYSDFVARASRYQYLTEESGIDKKIAIKMVLDEFINYNRLMPTVFRWMNSVGLSWFMPYFLGSNKSLIRNLKDRPSSILAMSLLLDAPNPSESSFFEKNYDYMFKSPFDVAFDGTENHILPPSTAEILFRF